MSKEVNFFKLKLLPIYILDYIWIITIYATTAIVLSVLIDGYLLPPYDEDETKKKPSWLLYIEVILQIALQGFIAIIVITLLQTIPSPVEGINGYGHGSGEALIIRTPAILTVLLFFLSRSLKGRLVTLVSRFDKNALANIYGAKLK